MGRSTVSTTRPVLRVMARDVIVRDVEQQQNIQEREAMEALDVIVVKGQVLQHGGSLEQDRRQHSQAVVIQLREERSLSGIVTI